MHCNSQSRSPVECRWDPSDDPVSRGARPVGRSYVRQIALDRASVLFTRTYGRGNGTAAGREERPTMVQASTTRVCFNQSCRVVIINEVLDTRTELLLPQTTEEALCNCVAVADALEWADTQTMLRDDPESLAVSIRHNDATIVIRWYCNGDPESALVAMQQVLSGWKDGPN